MAAGEARGQRDGNGAAGKKGLAIAESGISRIKHLGFSPWKGRPAGIESRDTSKQYPSRQKTTARATQGRQDGGSFRFSFLLAL